MYVVLPVGLLALLATGVVYFRLMQGPVSLKFLVDPVQRGIAAELPGFHPSIDDVVVALKNTGGLEFRLRNLKVADGDGDLVIAAPYAATQLSRVALMSMQAVPVRVELIEPQLFLSYSRVGGLKLQFSPVGEAGRKRSGSIGAGTLRAPAPKVAQRPAGDVGNAAAGGPDSSAPFEQIDLVRFLRQFSHRDRSGSQASSNLQSFGLRDATVVLDHEGIVSRWRVEQFAIDLAHAGNQTRMAGLARVSSQAGPWTFKFRTHESDASQILKLHVSVNGLFPRTLGNVFPQLSLLKPLDVPVSGNAQFFLSENGKLESGDLAVALGQGRIHLPTLARTPIEIDGGELGVEYHGPEQRIDLKPSTLRWGESSLTLEGLAKAKAVETKQSESAQEWVFDVRAKQGVMTVSEFGIPPMAIDAWQAKGSVLPSAGNVKLASFRMVVGGGELTAAGEIDTASNSPGIGIEGRMNAMPIGTLAALWPRAVAPVARDFFGQSVLKGAVRTGSLKIQSGRFLRDVQSQAPAVRRLALAIELADVVMRPSKKYPPVQMARALVRLENDALEVAVPKSHVVLSDKETLGLKSGRFTAVNIDRLGAVGEIAFQVDSNVGPAVDLLRHATPEILTNSAVPLEKVSGKINGDIRLSFPLDQEVVATDVKFGGKMRLSDGRVKRVFGNYDISGATIDFDLSHNSLNASGEVLLNGVLAKVNWQRFLNASQDRQPPLRMTAKLDDADRKQLDLDFGDALRGVTPVEFTINPASASQGLVHMRADLTGADLVIDGIAWRKKPGRSAFLEADLVGRNGNALKLENLKLAGDSMAIAGTVDVNENNEIVAYDFPDFSLDVVTRLSVRGSRDAKKIWKVDARGRTYDGRSFFRAMFSVGRLADRSHKPLPKYGGVDLTARIDTVLGFSDVALRDVSMNVSKRAGKLTALKLRGTLDGGEPLAAEYRKDRGNHRLLLADSTDAGKLFKLIGFYPNVVGGRARLQVNLDGRGPAEKTGILWVEKFRILGDPIVTEVVSNAGTSDPSKKQDRRKRTVVRQVFDFDNMRAPFSVGHGQFVLEDAYMKGPLIGATLRGKVDYNRKHLNIGGTYIPLHGLNNAFGTIPLLGDLLSGPRKEGIFGMTFAIQGPMDRPQVLVNPFSFVAPGILREIFQLTPFDPRVKPVPQKPKSSKRSKQRVRASSSQAIGDGRNGSIRARGQAPSSTSVDGWSSRTR